MVNFMRPADGRQIPVATFKGLEAVMNKPIVKDEIDGAVGTDTCTYPKAVI